MSEPLGYFLTWRCYGTWLHGDPRGSVDDLHSEFATPVLPYLPHLHRRRAESLTEPPVNLTRNRRQVVGRAVEDHSRIRGRPLWIVNPRVTHVHTVVGAPGYQPEIVEGQLKGWATRRLREQGLYRRRKTPWANQGSTRWLWTMEEIANAVQYLRDQDKQGERYRGG